MVLQVWWIRTTGYNKVLPLLVPTNRGAEVNCFDWTFVQSSIQFDRDSSIESPFIEILKIPFRFIGSKTQKRYL